jgi:tRNA (mo5U34)-methyltransferase
MLFTGVFYHLWDPLIILQKIAALTKDVLVLETHMDACYLTQPTLVHYAGRELQDDPTNWWGPNIACVYALLKQVGFGGRIIFSPVTGAAWSIRYAACFAPSATKNPSRDAFPARWIIGRRSSSSTLMNGSGWLL